MAVGLAILLAVLVGFTVKALLDATDEIIDEFENKAVILLDVHAGMLGMVTTVSAALGTIVSFHIDGATGACIVLTQASFFILAFLFAPKRGIFVRTSYVSGATLPGTDT